MSENIRFLMYLLDDDPKKEIAYAIGELRSVHRVLDHRLTFAGFSPIFSHDPITDLQNAIRLSTCLPSLSSCAHPPHRHRTSCWPLSQRSPTNKKLLQHPHVEFSTLSHILIQDGPRRYCCYLRCRCPRRGFCYGYAILRVRSS